MSYDSHDTATAESAVTRTNQYNSQIKNNSNLETINIIVLRSNTEYTSDVVMQSSSSLGPGAKTQADGLECGRKPPRAGPAQTGEPCRAEQSR